ncbi:MAG: helicase-exonuclease AddAB subunit AddA [Clostridiales bacterium]|nr:helicase-exonuclease AddAB subunit AddA [Clostridiales bacterium]
MSNDKWTESQLMAINTVNKNLLVSAGAGAGKTSVLVERIINLISKIEYDIDIDQLVVMTFTKAAAYEMKERIRHALYEKIKKQPDNQYLSRQLLLLNRSTITTIHAFCSEIVKEYYHVLDVDPSFSIVDNTKKEQLIKESLDEVFMVEYENKNEQFLKLVNKYGTGYDDSKLYDLVIEIHKFIMSSPDPLEQLDIYLKYYKVESNDFFKHPFGKEIKDITKLHLQDAIEQTKDALLLLDEKLYSGYFITISSDLDMFNGFLESLLIENYDSMIEKFSYVSFERLGRNNKEADKNISKIVKKIRDAVKGNINKIKDLYQNNSNEQQQIFSELYPMMEQLVKIIKEFYETYQSKKKKEGLLDYNDLEHFSLKCLKSGADKVYQQKYKGILVDEYQDSNLVQEAIINHIKKDNNLFLVGDVKQSIYRFRNANPQLFMDKYQLFPNVSKDEINGKIELNSNFRSRGEILDMTNFVFSKIMSKNSCDMDYTKDQYLSFSADYYSKKESNVEVLISNGKGNIVGQYDTKDTIEAVMIANKIIELVNNREQIYDKNTSEVRSIKFSDIVILLRATNNKVSELIDVCKIMGIPIFADDKLSFFEDEAVSRVINFLAILDNPYQDIPLLSIMRSDFFSFTDQELVVITTENKSDSIYECVLDYKLDDSLKEKIVKFLENLSYYRHEASIISLEQLIWRIVTETGFYYIADTQALLNKKQITVRRLFEIAGQFEKTDGNQLFSFLQYVKEHIEKESDLAGAKTIGEKDNVVRIMTIHKSKGLEFPVVFVSHCGKTHNKTDLKNQIILHRQLGFGAEYVNYEESYKFPTVLKRLIARNIDRENMAEEMRVLYVAMTRAREKLYITGHVDKIENACIKWLSYGLGEEKQLLSGNVLKCNSYLDWIMSALTRSTVGQQIALEAGMSLISSQKEKVPITLLFLSIENIKDQIKPYAAMISQDKIETSLSNGELDKRFSYEYPYKKESLLPRKISVTEIKKMAQKAYDDDYLSIYNNQLIEKPTFLKEVKKIDRSTRGTMIHNILGAIKFDKALDDEYLEKCIKGLEVDEFVIPSIKRFFNDDIGKRLLKAKTVYREKSFMVSMKTSNIYPLDKKDIPPNHHTLVQGVIDLMFVEDDMIVLIDYKTDYVENGLELEKAKEYQVQLDTYAYAIEKIMNKKVKEKIIYLLHNGTAINL